MKKSTANEIIDYKLAAPAYVSGGRNGLYLPHGLIKSPENLSDHDFTLVDPMDLSGAARITRDIITDMVNGCTPENPLVPIVGEEHKTSAHVMFQSALAHALADWRGADRNDQHRQFLWAEEVSFDSVGHPLKDLPESLLTKLPELDDEGRVFLELFCYDEPKHKAPYTNHQKWTTLLNNAIPTTPTDTAIIEQNNIEIRPVAKVA